MRRSPKVVFDGVKAVTVTTETKLAQESPGLRRGAIGLREVLFQSVTGMAPGAAIAASIPAGAAYAGGSLPLAVVFALIACLLTASSIGLLAREMPAAGSLATYAARGLHPAAGFLTAWGYVRRTRRRSGRRTADEPADVTTAEGTSGGSTT
jgi:hypothetical protein